MFFTADDLAITSNVLHGVGAARIKKGLSADETLIYLAVGHLGIASVGGVTKAIPVRCADIGSLLKIPRETVRRKSERLVFKNLVTISASGIVIADLGEWKSFLYLFNR